MRDGLQTLSADSLRSYADTDLVRLALNGDMKAFETLIARHASALRSQLRRMGASPEVADDMSQESFIAAFESLGTYRADGPFIGWLKKVAVRKYLRYVKSNQKYLLVDDMSSYDTADNAPESYKSPNFEAALATLKPIERLCLGLHFTADLSHSEIAEQTGLALGSVKSHIKRAVDSLKQKLAPTEAGQ